MEENGSPYIDMQRGNNTKLASNHKGAIAYQTVKAKINILGKHSVQCCMLRDTGSDETYLVQRIADKLEGRPIRHETQSPEKVQTFL